MREWGWRSEGVEERGSGGGGVNSTGRVLFKAILNIHQWTNTGPLKISNYS